MKNGHERKESSVSIWIEIDFLWIFFSVDFFRLIFCCWSNWKFNSVQLQHFPSVERGKTRRTNEQAGKKTICSELGKCHVFHHFDACGTQNKKCQFIVTEINHWARAFRSIQSCRRMFLSITCSRNASNSFSLSPIAECAPEKQKQLSIEQWAEA